MLKKQKGDNSKKYWETKLIFYWYALGFCAAETWSRGRQRGRTNIAIALG